MEESSPPFHPAHRPQEPRQRWQDTAPRLPEAKGHLREQWALARHSEAQEGWGQGALRRAVTQGWFRGTGVTLTKWEQSTMNNVRQHVNVVAHRKHGTMVTADPSAPEPPCDLLPCKGEIRDVCMRGRGGAGVGSWGWGVEGTSPKPPQETWRAPSTPGTGPFSEGLWCVGPAGTPKEGPPGRADGQL